MKQILAIFTKDVRRFWPEILITCLLLVALVLAYPRQWSGTDAVASGSFGFWFSNGNAQGLLADALIVLIPIAWWILIARLVHCERLIGHTQFWITRPYTWPKLLAAKLLFLAAFVYAPFFIAQCMLLREGGFHPFSYLPGLILNLFFLTATLVLPLVALSALTTGFGRMTLVVLGVLLFIAAAAVGSNFLPSSTYGSIPDLVSGNAVFAILFCGCAAIVLVQYVRHRVRLAWLLLVAAALGMWATAAFDPDQSLMDRTFLAASSAPLQLAYGGGEQHQPITTGTTDKSMLSIHIPVRESGVADGDVVVPVALRATIQGSGGAMWQSPWQGIPAGHYLPGESISMVRFVLPGSVYDRFKTVPVTLRLNFALVRARRTSATVIPLPKGEFSVSGFGVCRPRSWFDELDDYSNISCRSAMNQPNLTYVSTRWTEGRCADPSAQPGPQSTAWTGQLDPLPAEFGITSVWETPVNLSNPWIGNRRDEAQRSSLCPGTPVSFTQFRQEARMQTDLVISDFRLPELSLGDKYMMTTPSH